MKTRSVMALAIVLMMAAWAPAQQVKVYDNKSATSDPKSAPMPPEMVPAPHIPPPMIGDMGSGPLLSPIKIGESESPRPMDRFYFAYNYFSDVESGRRRFFTSMDERDIDIHRFTLGFEKAFLGDRASIEVRLPFAIRNESFLDDSQSDTDFGDMSVGLKYTLFSSPKTGNLLSTGLSFTLPTSTREVEDFGRRRDDRDEPVLIQPWIGYVLNWDRFYVQGFSSGVVPVDDCGKSTIYNDVGLGYYAYESQVGIIRAVVPTVEFHTNTPVDRGCTSLNITGGVHTQIYNRAWITAGITVPVAGRERFDVEGAFQFNYIY